MTKKTISPIEEAHFKFALIAPVIQGLYPDASAAAYYRRVTARTLDDVAIEEIYNLREKFPHINATMIHQLLIKNGFIKADISVRSVQRFIKQNDLKSARCINVKDRKAFEEEFFGSMWQSDTCYLPYITENGKSRRTYLIMIIDDHSRMIVGGEIFYNDNAYNFQKVLKKAVSTFGLPNKLYLDNGSSYSNEQLTLICGSLGIIELHTPVRDGASKGKVERNFRTLKDRWLHALDTTKIHSLAEFNELLQEYIHQHNTTIHSSTKEAPVNRFMNTKEHIRIPKSQEWIDECFQNRITRKVNNDSCITIDGITYDAPMQFIRMKVDIRYLPDHMEDAYILYEGKHYPLRKTDKNANSKTKRNNNYPVIKYSGMEV